MRLQLINGDSEANIQVLFDRKIIFEGTPRKSENGDEGPLPVTIELPQLTDHLRHTIVAQNTQTRTKAVVEWTGEEPLASWFVIRYYPGRGSDNEPPFFTFAFQKNKVLLK